MANNGRAPLQRQPSSSRNALEPPRPAMFTLPSTSSAAVDNLFAVPGPMTMVSSFFAENDQDQDADLRSFSQLLGGAVGRQETEGLSWESGGGGGEFRFQQNRPMGLIVSPQMPGMFAVPPGLIPGGLLDSPVLFSSGQAQAQAQQQMHIQSVYSTLPGSMFLHQQLLLPPQQQILPPTLHTSSDKRESSDFSRSNFAVNKPIDDGYNWRKYGQKQVKGSEHPRSYYKCTYQNCPVKKKVERSLDGQVTEIIYKGQHNHPAPSKRAKTALNPSSASESNHQTGNNMPTENQESSQNTSGHESGSSDSEEVGNAELGVNGNRGLDQDEPNPKRRNIEVQTSSHRTVTEPRIVVQTTSEIDLLEDGYRWRKYGQKVVKGNRHPRSYYKCTHPGCNVRKHVERSANDSKAVITTYEGKHTHDVPAAKSGSYSHANAAAQSRAQNGLNDRTASNGRVEFKNVQPQPMALVGFKEEHIPYSS